MSIYPYLNDFAFLKALGKEHLQEIFVKITILNFEEYPIGEIQGKITTGQITISGDSAVRRTGSLTFIPDEKENNLTDADNIISINKKVKIEIGQTNTLNDYLEYDIVWFPMGVYIITDVNASNSLSGQSISITMQDKMCLLNGTCGGTISSAFRLDEIEIEDGLGNITSQKVPIYTIIQQLVNIQGKENLSKIIINDIELQASEIVKWTGSNDLLLQQVGSTLEYTLAEIAPTQGTYSSQEIIGYRLTDFVYPDELLGTPGQSICDVLNKIRDTLGNYEYFYDLDGNFIFQEIKNYLNTSYSSIVIDAMTNENYQIRENIRNKTIYDFNDNDLIVSIDNNPSYSSIKNDFVVWGKRKTAAGTFPIRYHLALDTKPIPIKSVGGNIEDWRNVLYREGIEDPNTNDYFLELETYWPQIYDVDNYVWQPESLSDPSSIDYFLDFVDSTDSLSELNIENIGRRTVVLNDENINCIFAPDIPNFLIFDEGEDIAGAISEGMNYIILNPAIINTAEIKRATNFNDAFSAVRNMLSQYTSYNTVVNLTTVPIYYLDVNNSIAISDIDNQISGEYIIKDISIPLQVSELMSMSAIAAITRV